MTSYIRVRFVNFLPPWAARGAGTLLPYSFTWTTCAGSKPLKCVAEALL
jgi:hypothetical protein